MPAQRTYHPGRLILRRAQRAVRHGRRLPALAIVAAFLPVSDRRAEMHPVDGADGQQRDLRFEADELLDDHARSIAPHVCDGKVVSLAEFLYRPRGALPFAAARHDGLDHTRQPDMIGGSDRLLTTLRKAVTAGFQPQFARGELADAVAVHGQTGRPGRWCDAPALRLECGQRRRIDRLDFGNDHVGPVLLHRRPKRRAIKHREDLASVRHLHRRSPVIPVAGDHLATQPLGGYGELPAKLARAQQHQSGDEHGHALTSLARRRESVFPPHRHNAG